MEYTIKDMMYEYFHSEGTEWTDIIVKILFKYDMTREEAEEYAEDLYEEVKEEWERVE